jgi:DNA invertase Pin-like site-specific DNA recombinase
MGWRLAEKRFVDKGVSAWRGKNREEGELGKLLKVVQPGEIIILEALDRWSRQDPCDSVIALRKHIERGVGFYFGSVGRVVNAENYRELRIVLNVQAELAAQYSERNSFRIREAMKRQREMIVAEGTLGFGRLPGWLKWSDKPKVKERKPVIVPDKAEAVKTVYRLYLEGKGVQAIATAMRGVPPISCHKRSNWNSTFIYQLLKSRSVLGEHTPSKTPGIFPVIIGEGEFFRVQQRMQTNKHQTASPRTANANLFSGLVKCSVCGHPLTRQTVARGLKRYAYLICSGRLRDVQGCKCASGDFHSIRYEIFENSFMSLLNESGLINKLLADARPVSPVDDLKARLADVQKRADALMKLVEESGVSESGRIGKRLTVLEGEEVELQKQIDAALTMASALPAHEAFDRFNREKLAKRVHEPESRSRIRHSMRDFVERIEVELGNDLYHVHLKGAAQPIQVALNKAGWAFNPSPLWVTQKVVYETLLAAGKFAGHIA